MRRTIRSDDAPAPVGPYSQAVEAGGLLWLSGQLGLRDGVLADGVAAQARQALANLRAVLAARGLGMEAVVKTTLYLQHIDDFAAVNGVYAEFFPAEPPARAVAEVAALPLGGLVLIEAVAVVA